MSDQQICDLYAELRSGEAVSVEAGVSPSQVLIIVKRMGRGDLIIRRGSPGAAERYRKIPLTDEEIATRYMAGESGTAIAKSIKCSPNTIYAALERSGTPRRSSRWQWIEYLRSQAAQRRLERAAAMPGPVRKGRR